MKKISSLQVICRMIDDNDPGCRFAPLGNIIAVDQKGSRCTMTIGVQAEDVKNYMLNKTGHGGLFLIDGEAFAETEKKMLKELEATA